MRRLVLLAGVLASSVLLAGAAGAPPAPPTPDEREMLRKDPLRPATRSTLLPAQESAVVAAQDQVDVTRYFLDLEFVPATRSVQGTVTVTAKSLVPGLGHLVLDLHDAMVVSAVTRGSTTLSFTHAGNILDIALDAPFAPGAPFDVTIAYSGVPNTSTQAIGWNKYRDGVQGNMVWTLSEPDGARLWWPCKDRPDDKAAVEEWWTVPATWTATGNGVLVATVDLPGGRKRFQWRPTHPLTTYLVSIAATTYVSFSDTYTTLASGSMPLTHYVYAEDLADAQESFRATPAMIRFFAETFGEYPFVEDKYGMSAFPWSGAMEHATNTSYAFFWINGAHNLDFVVAHELAHQWFGDSVSPETWADVWLNEGTASYCEALWWEHLYGAQGYRDYVRTFLHPSFTGPVYNPTSLFGVTVYDKGALVHHMLRHVLGSTAYFDALRAWYAAYKDGVGNTAQLQAILEAQYGGSLAWFFDEWVYGSGMPRYEYGFASATRGDGSYRTYVRVRQVQTDAGLFRMPVDLTLVTATGSELRTVWNTQADEDFVLDTTEPILDVLFDQDGWLLSSSVTRVSLADTDGDGVPDRNDDCASTANASQADADADLHGDACDCAPSDPATWSVPAETENLTFLDRATVTWTAPVAAGGTADSFDLLRSVSAGDFSTATCVASGLATTTVIVLDATLAGGASFYLVRARNACGEDLGQRSDGTPRSAPACP